MTDAPYTPETAESAPHVELSERFALIPEALLYDPSIPADAVRLYGVLRRHGSDPSNCYPSHRRLAELVGRSARSIPAWLRLLEDAGWIDRVPRMRPNGDPDSNGYRVHGCALQRGVCAEQRAPLPAEQRAPSPLSSAPKESKGTRAISNEKELATIAEQRAPERLLDMPESAPLGFDDFWKLYPYKRGSRAAAERAWRGAVRAAGSAAVIVEGVCRFAADPNLPGRDEQQFVRHGSTWLRDRGWEDGPLPPRAGRPRAPELDADRQSGDGEWVPDPAAPGGWRLIEAGERR